MKKQSQNTVFHRRVKFYFLVTSSFQHFCFWNFPNANRQFGSVISALGRQLISNCKMPDKVAHLTNVDKQSSLANKQFLKTWLNSYLTFCFISGEDFMNWFMLCANYPLHLTFTPTNLLKSSGQSVKWLWAKRLASMKSTPGCTYFWRYCLFGALVNRI